MINRSCLATISMATSSNKSSPPGTSKQDLVQILSKCKKCLNLTGNGSNIIPFNQLNNIHLNNNKAKQCFIINTVTEDNKIGHWFFLGIYLRGVKRDAILADGLDIVKGNKEVMTSVKNFCKKNNLNLFTVKTRYQKLNSIFCGFLSLYFVCRLSLMPLSQFIKFDLMMSSYSIKTIEEFLLRVTKSHFNY